MQLLKKNILFLNKSLTAVSLADKAHKNHKETNDLHLSAAAPEMQKWLLTSPIYSNFPLTNPDLAHTDPTRRLGGFLACDPVCTHQKKNFQKLKRDVLKSEFKNKNPENNKIPKRI